LRSVEVGCGGEVELGADEVVEVVGEDRADDLEEDLEQLGIGPAGIEGGGPGRVVDVALLAAISRATAMAAWVVGSLSRAPRRMAIASSSLNPLALAWPV
jgi:hypothetical protein